ncbi:MAG: hypothetical protein PF445_10020 [Melioribacteraceae bacterium]|jgi:uncharacterized protein involved in exopolysaccharide biosynthesis|nr:hypothetical protein [Melioribacteraceae bacterium]
MENENNIVEEEQSFEDTIKKLKPYFNKVKINFKKLVIINFAVAVIAVILLLVFGKPYFTSSVIILPDYGNSSMMGSLSGLAAMAGVSVGDAAPTEIYEKLLMSESVIKDIVMQKYATEEYEDSINLIDYFEIEANEDLSLELQKRAQFLAMMSSLTKGRIKTEVDRMTKVLTISVTMPEAKLSADVTNRLVSALDNYVTIDRQSTAREQSQYLNKRLSNVKDTLNTFENDLLVFTENNRTIGTSPRLILEQARIKRKIEITQEIFLSLTTQYEITKLEEVKDTPVLNIMERAEQPMKKAGPKRLTILIIILFFSGTISLIYFLFIERIREYWEMVKN